jgi:hypothetical protein
MPQVSTASAPPPASRRLQVLPRILAAILGGYVFAWGTVALTTSALFALKLAFHDAEFLGALVGLLAYLGAFLWAIATHHADGRGRITPAIPTGLSRRHPCSTASVRPWHGCTPGSGWCSASC